MFFFFYCFREQGGEINDIFELISSNPNLALTAFQDSTNNVSALLVKKKVNSD